MKSFKGNVIFLDRADINTDEIIPAKYLTEISKEALQPFLLEDLKLDSFNPVRDLDNKQIIITRSNFGCGSSREHAVWALEVNGINLVIAEDFARIFKQNMFHCGMAALELSPETIDSLFHQFQNKQAIGELNMDEGIFIIQSGDDLQKFPIKISDFEKEMIKSGGWVEYADTKY